MEIAFTTPRETGTSNDLICVIDYYTVPRKDDLVEINDYIYKVETVEWHINTESQPTTDDENQSGKVIDIIVRLEKVGPA